MAEYIVTRTTAQSGSSYENVQKRSFMDGTWLYALQNNFPLMGMLGGHAVNGKTGRWEKYNGVIRSIDKKTKKIEWQDKDLISFETQSSSAVADTSSTTLTLSSEANYNKMRANDVWKCKETGEKIFVTVRAGSNQVTMVRGIKFQGSSSAANIPANANWVLVGRGLKEYSSAGTERGSLSANAYNSMQIFREDKSISRSEIQIRMEEGIEDPKAESKMESMYSFAYQKEAGMIFGGRDATTDTDSNAVTLMGGIDDYVTANILAGNAGDSSIEFDGWGHGGTLSYDEFEEFSRVQAKYWNQGETCYAIGGSLFKKCITTWARNYPGSQFQISPETDKFGFNVTKVKTPYLDYVFMPDGIVETIEPGSVFFIDPKLLTAVYLQRDKYIEVDMSKTANRTDGEAWTLLCEMSLAVRGSKRFGKIEGITGVES